jgi:ribosomal protein S27E
MPKADASRLAAKANQLYWGTSKPAGHLAEELGVSRSKFYALIEPLRLDVKCPGCCEPLVFSSRSDREASRGRCPGCGAVTEIPADEAPAAPPPAPEPAEAPVASAIGSRLTMPGNRELWFTAIVGVAIGLAFTGWWRRR